MLDIHVCHYNWIRVTKEYRAVSWAVEIILRETVQPMHRQLEHREKLRPNM